MATAVVFSRLPVFDLIESSNNQALVNRLEGMSINDLIQFNARCIRIQKVASQILGQKLNRRTEMSLFTKARAFTLGNMHELLDKAIDVNSPAVLKQYVRDLESAITQLKSEAAIQAGGVRTLNREIGDLQQSINMKKTAIQTRLKEPGVDTTDSLVRSWAAQVTNWQKELDQKRTVELPEKQKVASALDAAVAKLETKHTDMVSNVRRLESLSHTATAKSRAVDALDQAGKLSSGADSISIDNLQERVQAKADVADEKFDRAMGDEAFAESPEQKDEVDNLLSSLKTA